MNKRKGLGTQEELDESSGRKIKREKNEYSEYKNGETALKHSGESVIITPTRQDDKSSMFIPVFRIYDIGRLGEVTAAFQGRTTEDISIETHGEVAKIFPKSSEQERIVLDTLKYMEMEIIRGSALLEWHNIWGLVATTKPEDVAAELRSLGFTIIEVLQLTTENILLPIFIASAPIYHRKELYQVRVLCDCEVQISTHDSEKECRQREELLSRAENCSAKCGIPPRFPEHPENSMHFRYSAEFSNLEQPRFPEHPENSMQFRYLAGFSNLEQPRFPEHPENSMQFRHSAGFSNLEQPSFPEHPENSMQFRHSAGFSNLEQPSFPKHHENSMQFRHSAGFSNLEQPSIPEHFNIPAQYNSSATNGEPSLKHTNESINLTPTQKYEGTGPLIPAFKILDINKFYEIVTAVQGRSKEEIKILAYTYYFKICPKSAEQERIILDSLTDTEIKFTRSLVPMKEFFIKGLLPNTKPKAIADELKTLGITTFEVSGLWKETKRKTQCPFFMVRAAKSREQALLQVKELCNRKVVITICSPEDALSTEEEKLGDHAENRSEKSGKPPSKAAQPRRNPTQSKKEAQSRSPPKTKTKNLAQPNNTAQISNAAQANDTAQISNAAQPNNTAQISNAAQANDAAQISNLAQANEAAQIGNAAQANDTAQISNDAQPNDAAQISNAAQANDAAQISNDAQPNNTAQISNAAQASDAAQIGNAAQPNNTAQISNLAQASNAAQPNDTAPFNNAAQPKATGRFEGVELIPYDQPSPGLPSIAGLATSCAFHRLRRGVQRLVELPQHVMDSLFRGKE